VIAGGNPVGFPTGDLDTPRRMLQASLDSEDRRDRPTV